MLVLVFARTCFLLVAGTEIVADDAGGGSLGDRGNRIIHRGGGGDSLP
jgi:hypothetical protein